MALWITFDDGSQACVNGTVEAARDAGVLPDKAIIEEKALPYPAAPCLYNPSGHPLFCISPRTCAGRTSCPHEYACSE